jgi:hypothetical protein
MNYRFISDDEPTDEQLQVIMKEVETESRKQSEHIRKSIVPNINKEYEKMIALFPQLAIKTE